MNEGLIPRRYAKALYKVAVDRNDAEALYGMFNRLLAAASVAPDLRSTIANPFVSDDDKRAIIKTAVGQDPTSGIFDDFLKLLAQNHRLDIALDVARDFEDLYRHERSIYRVTVTSASPLDADEELRIKKLIQDKIGDGTMEYSAKVDPDLIGGFTVAIDNTRLDASVKNELKQLRLNLLQ